MNFLKLTENNMTILPVDLKSLEHFEICSISQIKRICSFSDSQTNHFQQLLKIEDSS